MHDAFSRLQRAERETALPRNAAEAEAGTYPKGRLDLHGLPITLENARLTVRYGTSKAGKKWQNRMAASYGEFDGTVGNDGDPVDCFIGLFPETRRVWVINQGWPDGGFDEHKVMLGFANESEARRAYLGSFDRDWQGLRSVAPCTINQLKWWLARGDMRKPLTLDQLPFDGSTDMNTTTWNQDAQPVGKALHQVMYELRVSDAGHDLLLDSVTMEDFKGDPEFQGEAEPLLDALVVKVARMDQRMTLLQTVMAAAGGDVQPVRFTISDPVRARGVLMVAVLFELSDGQAVTAWFHNPDTTPARLTPMDDLVSWKWMLNKKDITIVVAPERGKELNVREVARRIMRLAEKNSAKFQAANANAAAAKEQEQGIDAELVALSARLASLDDQIAVERQRQTDTQAQAAKALADPTTAAGYAAIKDDEAKLLYWQDDLDAFFQSRIIEVREALRTLGWAGEPYQILSKDAGKLQIDTMRMGGGGNVVGVTYRVKNEMGGEVGSVRDELTGPAGDVAFVVDAFLLTMPQPEQEPAREAWRVEADAFGEGKVGYVGTRDQESAAGIITSPLGSWAFSRMGDNFWAIYPTGEGKYTGGDAHPMPDDAYASMVAQGRWIMLQSEIAAAARPGDPADKLAPGSFVPAGAAPDGEDEDAAYQRKLLAERAALIEKLTTAGMTFPSIDEFMVEVNAGRRLGFSVADLTTRVAEYKADMAAVNMGTKTPRRVVGKGGTKKQALKWLEENIEDYSRDVASDGYTNETNMRNYNSTLGAILRGAETWGAAPVTGTAAVDAAYAFGAATDDFKLGISHSIDKADYSAFKSAVTIDKAAQAAGMSVAWDTAGLMDAVAAADRATLLDSVAVAAAPYLAEGVILDFVGDVSAAIAELEVALDVMTTNEPINRAEGKVEQADLEASNAVQFRAAIAVLRAPVLDAVDADAEKPKAAETEDKAEPKEGDEPKKDDGADKPADAEAEGDADEGKENTKAADAESNDEDEDEDDDTDPEKEWEATPEDDADNEKVLDGDFPGHPFRGNQHAKSHESSGAAVKSSMRAKHAERKGDAKSQKASHGSAHYSHKAASLHAVGKAKKYHQTMAKFHGKRGGIMDAVDVPDSVVPQILDAVSKGDAEGTISKGGVVVGRVGLALGDGKAVVFKGAEGDDRAIEGMLMTDDESDLAAMVQALAVSATPLPEALTPENTPAAVEPSGLKPVEPQTPDRVEWEGAVARAIIEADDVSNGDAQAMMEAQPDTVDAQFAAGAAPADAAAAILAAATPPDAGVSPVDAPANATFYVKGDLVEYTGKVEQISGGTFYEYKFLEGASIGKTGVTQRAPDGTNPGQATPQPSSGIVTPQVPVAAAAPEAVADDAADRAYLESLIDGTGDLLAADTDAKLEPLFEKYGEEGVTDMSALLIKATTAYSEAAIAAVQATLAKA